MTKKTICVDFDGVLNEYNGYEEGNLGELLTGSKEFIKELRKKYKVVILTSRQKEQVIDWLNNNGFPSMKVTNRKVPAVAYIDDRATIQRKLQESNISIKEFQTILGERIL